MRPDGIDVDADGRWTVPVVRGWSSTSDAHAEAYLTASNRLVEAGGWDPAALAAMLTDVDTADPTLLAATGFTDADLAALLDRLATADPAPDPNADNGTTPAAVLVDEPPTSAAGDLWLLGEHRLAVGDATDPATWTRLMGGADDGTQAALLWTDPPYGVDYVGKTPRALTITGDQPDGAPDLLADVLHQARPHLTPGSHLYVAHPGGPLGARFVDVLATSPWRYKIELVWTKHAFVLGHADYHYQHENISFARLVELAADPADPTSWTDVATRVRAAADHLERAELEAANDLLGLAYDDAHQLLAYGQLTGRAGRRGRGGAGWYGGNAATTVFAVPRPTASRDHPTTKPVDLIAAHIRNSTRRGQLVLDPFAGSGSTLIACAREGRTARLIELDPHYADAICRRWQATTGTRPVHAATGQPVDFPARQDSAA